MAPGRLFPLPQNCGRREATLENALSSANTDACGLIRSERLSALLWMGTWVRERDVGKGKAAPDNVRSAARQSPSRQSLLGQGRNGKGVVGGGKYRTWTIGRLGGELGGKLCLDLDK